MKIVNRLALGLLFSMATAMVCHGAEHPNIILMMADDLGYGDVTATFERGKIPTPHIDRLAKEGMMFTDAHTNSSVCAPTRYGILTGRYCWRTEKKNGVLHGHSHHLIDPARETVASFLKKHGYATACIGKWHLGMDWTSSDGQKVNESNGKNVDFQQPITNGPLDVGFDYYFGISASLNHPPHAYVENREVLGKLSWVEGKSALKERNINGKDGWAADNYQQDEVLSTFTQKTVDWLEQHQRKASQQPFFAYWPTVIPHGPYSTTPEAGEVMDVELEKPDTGGMSREQKAKVLEEYQHAQAQRFINLIQYMDKLIGKLIAKTEELGIYEETYFIFCADNGTAVTAKDRGVERGVHVPYAVKGPGVERRGITDELTDFADIAPTLLDMAGVRHAEDVKFDGKSQLPFLSGQSKSHREWIYAYTGPVQVLRTKTHLLEARAPFFGKPRGRFYYTGESRFGCGYLRVEDSAEHQEQRTVFDAILSSLPSHLEADHPFWTSKHGKRWLGSNDVDDVASKQLYNHPDYSFYDEQD